MNYLLVENITKTYADKTLFKNISFSINKGERVALVAKNGAGKTTLLKIIENKEVPDSGNFLLSKKIDIAFLHQEPLFNEGDTIIQALKKTESKVTKAIKNYEYWQEKVNVSSTTEILDKLDQALNLMNDLDAWNYENNVEQILFNLQIRDTNSKISTLSGGQKKRVAIAQILVQSPDFIIMDEPTNHLDIEMIEWLENYLIDKKITLFIVTHDRYFLDNICTEIFELDGGQLFTYRGNFSYYLEKKAERQIIENSELEKAKNLYKRELEWIRKQPKARTVKSKSRVDAFEDIAEKAKKRKIETKIQLDVKMERLGGKILELVKLSKNFGTKKILEQFSYVFQANEKIGVVGKNGMGKTTLLNIIQGKEIYDAGKILIGETVKFGYYSQKGMEIKEDMRLIEFIKKHGEFIPLSNGVTLSASQLLTRFNFPAEQQYTFISKLSGGEKRRLYLLTILIKNPNFLILDEPTNDLDILTLQTLEEFLIDFKGCVLIVSHDRYFMDRICTSIFVFEGDGIVKNYPGNYSEYREWKEIENVEKELVLETKKEKIENKSQDEFLLIKKEIEKIEKEIIKFEEKKKDLENKLISNDLEIEYIERVSLDVKLCIDKLNDLNNKWVELIENKNKP